MKKPDPEAVASELKAHLEDLEHFEARSAKFEAATPDEAKAHTEDVAAFKARHAERVAELEAELA